MSARRGTYSIVARDDATGELGVAAQSHWFSVGSIVSWASPGVGAVATQSLVDPAYGPRMLDRLAAGQSPDAALRELLGADDGAGVRQVAAVDNDGAVAIHTGEGCIAHAGHAGGDGFSVQANMMASPGVPQAMTEAFAGAEGELSVRLLASLEAGQAAGGDARGQMSAALLVVPAEGEPWRRSVEIRVDYEEEPLPKLSRALRLQRAFELLDRAEERAGEEDYEGAMAAGMQGLELAGENPQLLLWLGLGAANTDIDIGLNLVRRALELQPSLGDFLGHLTDEIAPSASLVRSRLSEAP